MNRRNYYDGQASKFARKARYWANVAIVFAVIAVISSIVVLLIEMWPYLTDGR
jgi:type IV secretory pathway component VirB8